MFQLCQAIPKLSGTIQLHILLQ